MRVFRLLRLLLIVTCGIQSVGSFPPSAAGACDPEPVIVNQLPRMSGGWSGAVACYDGLIYEVSDAVNYANIYNPATGAQVGNIYFGSWCENDIKGFTYDRFRGTFWAKVGAYAYEVPVTGGEYISRIPINTGGLAFGIWKDPDQEHVMWVADPAQPQIRKVDMRNSSVLAAVNTDFHVRGVARAGNTLWCVRAGEPGQKGLVVQVDLSGNELCSYFLPSGKYEHDAGGCDIDPDGYLWIEGGKGTAIYQYDVGHHPTTPTPAPSPTPAETPTPIYSLHRLVDSGDYDGDGLSDLAVFRPATGFWAVRGVTRTHFGISGDIPVSGDYSGDGTTDIALFRPSAGLWAVRGLTRATFGRSWDIPVPGDYTGDGICDIAYYRKGSGRWAIRSVTRIYFGTGNDLPVPGYYTGSAAKDLAVFRPATGFWAVRGLTRTHFGRYGDYPVPGDYSGAGRDEIAVYRPGSRLWAVRGLTRTYFAHGSGQPQAGDYQGDGLTEPAVFNTGLGLWRLQADTAIYFGQTGDCPASAPPNRSGSRRLPVIDSGDYNGDGTSEIALFRDTAGLWAFRGETAGSQVYFGRKGDLPVSGDYDGDGSTDIAVYRPVSGSWSVRGVTRFTFGGEAGDLPAPGDYNGDGTCDSAVFNQWSALWRVRIEIPFSSRAAAGALFGDRVEGTAVTEEITPPVKALAATAPFTYEFQYGLPGDIPVPGYYAGGPRKVIAVFRPSTGFWGIRGITKFHYGLEGDFPVAADFTGDGTGAPGVFRSRERLWAIRGVTRIYYGGGDDNVPVPADYRGTGSDLPAVFRPASGLWAVRGLTRAYFGREGDWAVPAAYSGGPEHRPGIFREESGLWAVRGLTRLYFGASGDQPVSR